MKFVAPGDDTRRIAEGLNKLAAKISAGFFALGAGSSTVLVDSRIGPGSVIILTPASAGADTSTTRPVPGDGQATIMHGSQEGQSFGYVVVNP